MVTTISDGGTHTVVGRVMGSYVVQNGTLEIAPGASVMGDPLHGCAIEVLSGGVLHVMKGSTIFGSAGTDAIRLSGGSVSIDGGNIVPGEPSGTSIVVKEGQLVLRIGADLRRSSFGPSLKVEGTVSLVIEGTFDVEN